MVKPVSSRVLLARERRMDWSLVAESSLLYADAHLKVDFPRREVFVDGVLRELTPIEYSLLALFVQKVGEALSLEYLFVNVWRGNGTLDLIKWHVLNLRRKLYGKKSPNIVTVRGYGYKYDPPNVKAE